MHGRGIRMKLIKFRRLHRSSVVRNGVLIEVWEIAFNEKHLYAKLNGDMTEIIMPRKAWYVQLWRKIFPLKFEQRAIEK